MKPRPHRFPPSSRPEGARRGGTEMTLTEFEDAGEFHRTFSQSWLACEAECGVLFRIAKANPPGVRYFAVRGEHGGAALTACLHPADQVVFAGGGPRAAEHLAAWLAEQGLDVPGVFAPEALSAPFAARYTALTGKAFKLVKALGHYGLSELASAPRRTGEVRLATLNDQALLAAYRAASQREANTQRPVDPEGTVAQEIEARSLYVLALPDGQVVSTGSILWDRSPLSGYVDHVFTPVAHRGNGHASSLVFALSQRILAKHRVARLSVDVDNAPAIAVYEKLGYKKACQMNNLRQVAPLERR